MKLEQLNLNKQEKVPQKLEEMMPFLKASEEEINFNAEMKRAANLLSSGKMDEAIALGMSLRGKEPERKEFTNKEMQMFTESRENLAKQLGYKITHSEGKWLSLEKNGVNIEIQHFMLPSASGVNNGRISEARISKGKEFHIYDNGWDKKPKNEDIKKVFDEVVNYFN